VLAVIQNFIFLPTGQNPHLIINYVTSNLLFDPLEREFQVLCGLCFNYKDITFDCSFVFKTSQKIYFLPYMHV
jgi:hypothetical protein